jgi:hypothetical protein
MDAGALMGWHRARPRGLRQGALHIQPAGGAVRGDGTAGKFGVATGDLVWPRSLRSYRNLVKILSGQARHRWRLRRFRSESSSDLLL